MSFIQETYQCVTHNYYVNVALGSFGYGMPDACNPGKTDCKFDYVGDGWEADWDGKLKNQEGLDLTDL